MQNLKENWLMTWKLACSQKSENVHFDRLLLSKAYKVLDEKVHWRVISHDTEEWCEAWRETESWFQKWYEEFGEFYCEQWQVLCHNTEEWYKIWGELTYALKNDMRNLANFDPTLESLRICTLMRSFWPKHIMFKLKNYRGVI